MNYGHTQAHWALKWWSRRTGSNRRPDAPKAPALPTALHREKLAPPARLERATPGFVNQCSESTELRRQKTVGTGWCRRRDSNSRRPALQAGALPTELPRHGKRLWRFVRESNPRLPARQAGTLATELTKQGSTSAVPKREHSWTAVQSRCLAACGSGPGPHTSLATDTSVTRVTRSARTHPKWSERRTIRYLCEMPVCL